MRGDPLLKPGLHAGEVRLRAGFGGLACKGIDGFEGQLLRSAGGAGRAGREGPTETRPRATAGTRWCKKGLTFTLNREKLESDTALAKDKIASLSRAVAVKVKDLAKSVNDKESVLEGKVAGYDAETRTLTIGAGGESVPLRLNDAVDLQRDGAAAGFDQLLGTPVTVTLEKDGDDLIVKKIESK